MSDQPVQVLRGGRPRSEVLHQAILKAALDLVLEVGFRAVSLEAIAAKSGVGKTTIYRRWPNKGAVVMEAFIGQLEPVSRFPQAETAMERLRLQMHITAKAFTGRVGALVRALMAEAQFDPDLAQAFRENWMLPRRKLVFDALDEAIKRGEIRADIDMEAAIDIFYAPMYYRLQMDSGPLSEAFVEQVFSQAMEGNRKYAVLGEPVISPQAESPTGIA
jgi:AcrR family transcriptional regulator